MSLTESRHVGIIRARVTLLLVGFVIVGLSACGIFDRFEWVLLAAPLLPALSLLALVGRSTALRAVGAFGAVVATTVLATLFVGGVPGDVVEAITSGFQGLLSTEWPSPTRPDLIGTVAFVISAATAVSCELATRKRFHLLPLLPLLGAYGLTIAMSAPLGVNWATLIGIGIVTTTIALLHIEGTLGDRIVLLRGERRLALLVAMVAVLAALLTLPISLAARADPRHTDPPASSAPLLDPIESTLALRDLDPSVDLHVLTTDTDSPLPRRWRTTALSDYDGNRWTPELALRPIGRTLGPVTGPTVAAGIEFLDDDLSLVPLPGAPVTVDAAVDTDADRTVVRLIDRPAVGDVVPIVSNVAPTLDDARDAGLAGRLIDDDVATLSDLARELAGDGPPVDQLTQLASAMREGFTLDNEVRGGGLQRWFIEMFLRDTQRGNTEQFVTSYVLLVRSLGFDARVATGFTLGADTPSPASGETPLTSADATIWPEIRLADGRWLAIDPVPDDETSDLAPPPPEPQTQAPLAPQPPVAPPPEPETGSEPPENPEVTVSTSTLSTAITWAVRIGTTLGIVLLPFLVAAGLIVGVKQRRRRRRLTAPSAIDRIRGAWATATDALVDGGLSIGRSSTDAEIASSGEPIVADAGSELRRLAALSSAATYGTPAHEEHLAVDAARCLDSVEHAMLDGRTRRQRLQWRLSLRSLRSSTRSPVSD